MATFPMNLYRPLSPVYTDIRSPYSTSKESNWDKKKFELLELAGFESPNLISFTRVVNYNDNK